MERFEPMPSYIKAALAKREIWPKDVCLSAKADLTADGKFCEIWMAVTKQKVIVVTGDNVFSENRNKSKFKGRMKEVLKWKELDYNEYLMTDLDDLKVETLTASGMITAKIKGEEKVICSFTNGRARIFGQMVKLIGKIKEGKEITDDDFNDDQGIAYCPKCGLAYPDQSRKVCPKCMDKRSLFLRVLSFAPRYKVQITLIIVCMLTNALLRLLSPYIGGNVLFDQVLSPNGKYRDHLLAVVLFLAGTQLLALLINIIYGRINAGMTAEVIYDLKSEIFTAMQRLSLSFYNNKQTGSLMTRVNNDSNQLQYFFHDGMPYLIVNSLSIIGISVIMMLMNLKLALLVMIPVPFMILFFKVLFPKLWRMFSRSFRRNRAMNNLINDTLTGVRVVKAFGKEREEIKRFKGTNEGLYNINVDIGKYTSTVFPFISYFMSLGGLIVWGYGGWLVVNGRMTFGTLMSFTGYLGMLYGPLGQMTDIVNWWSSCMNSAQRIYEILDTVPTVVDRPNPVSIKHIKGDVELKEVTFSYLPNKPVLHDINLKVKAGEMIGIVGRSGAGKSTIANLITRLYDTEEGSISIDGVNVKDLRSSDIRRQVAMVLQDTYLFRGSIAENISYARPDATLDEIIAASKAACAHEFILKLPDGYDTVIGSKGLNLSGGERQRLSIARAILMNPRILILDEATSAIDTETERQIQGALDYLAKGRTTFAIAHRLSTLRNADRLVVLDEGRIVEIGTHEELMRKRGTYYELLTKQKEALRLKGVGE